jgi:SAM-dependent methyltransferase
LRAILDRSSALRDSLGAVLALSNGGATHEEHTMIQDRLKRIYWKRRGQGIMGLSRVGELTGQSWLTYHPWVYEAFWESAVHAAPGFARVIRDTFPEVRSAIDLGCGTGNYVAALRTVGIPAEGYEYSGRARRIASRRLGVELHAFDLRLPARLPQADLAMSLEVAEHVPAALGDLLVAALAGAAPLVVFTAATPGQGGIGHINEQPREYWRDRFARVGFTFEPEQSAQVAAACVKHVNGAPWIAQNVSVFRRKAV